MFVKILLVLITNAIFVRAIVLTDNEFSISAEVEPEWRLEKVDSSTLCIFNSDVTKKTKLYIERIVVDTVSVINDDEKAQMYFLMAYTVAKQYGGVQYFDSSRMGTGRSAPAV
jgi:hypothetical protein